MLDDDDGLFPNSPRVIYERTPLRQVICQLRFPTILRITAETPATFQEKVRRKFPIFERQAPVVEGQQLPPEIAQLIASATGGEVSYSFRTEDSAEQMTLGKDFIALTHNSYIQWEAFRESLLLGMEALVGAYDPTSYSRIGLRYINLLKRSVLGLDGRPWSELLHERIAGELALPWFEQAEEARRLVRLKLGDNGDQLLFQHGLDPGDAAEMCYGLDYDFYHQEKVSIDAALPILERLHDYSGKAFRWSIAGVVHESMGPRPI